PTVFVTWSGCAMIMRRVSRKTSVARVWLRPGSGRISVNGRGRLTSCAARFHRTCRPLRPSANLRLGGSRHRDRLLRLVGMGGAAVDLELLGHGPAEPALRHHPLHRPLDDALRMGFQHGLRSHFTEAPDVPRVPAIHLVAKLPSREMDLLGVHDHDVVAHVEVRREGRLVFPTEDRRDTTGEATEALTAG